MKTGLKGCLALGFVLSGSAAETRPVLSIQVSNQAEVASTTLTQAEKMATAILEKTGVEIRWIEPAAGGTFPLSHIQLKILPSVMSIRAGLPDDFPDRAMGLAPGSGPDRQTAYVFCDRVEALAKKRIATTAQILGHAMAHEIGHLLLNDQTHSPAGIMRGDWSLWDLQNASYGYLLFTTRQGKAIREEAGRRFIAPLPHLLSLPISGDVVQVLLRRDAEYACLRGSGSNNAWPLRRIGPSMRTRFSPTGANQVEWGGVREGFPSDTGRSSEPSAGRNLVDQRGSKLWRPFFTLVEGLGRLTHQCKSRQDRR